jgi:gamma-glutamyl-gamma-aminobutyrate hydrolase PuuD
MGARPVIGITGELDAAHWGSWIREAVVSPVSYTRAVERAGGVPVVLAPVPPHSIGSLTGAVDGLVFTGGRDLDSALYSQAPHEEADPAERRRDRFEIALMQSALEADLPLLAIGRGLQVMTVASGGALTQHLPGHRPDTAKYLPHDVQLSGESALGRLLGTQVQVPASHHQAPAAGRLGTGLTLVGWAPGDNVVEALEAGGRRFAVGVHWHPEESDDHRLMRALVAAAEKSRA